MKDMIKIGQFINTHGIKGEIRILSDFEMKDRVFVPDFKIYLGKALTEFVITGYRHHKLYEMVTLEGITNINDILEYKGSFVYIKRSDLNMLSTEYLIHDLIGMKVLEFNELIGKIDNIVYNNANILLKVKGVKDFYIPHNEHFIENVDLESKIVHVKGAKDLIL